MYLKSRVIKGLESAGASFVSLPEGSTPRKRGVYYFYMCAGIDKIRGAMDEEKEGRRCKKRIIVRPSRFRSGLMELYTYHFPKTWSAACVANRELIKEAQRMAHAIEKDFGPEGMEWRIRFFEHYFRVFKGGEKPAEGMKAYSGFYQYVYVVLYRELKAVAERANEEMETAAEAVVAVKTAEAEEISTEDSTFEPVDFSKPFRLRRRIGKNVLERAFRVREEAFFPPPI